MLPILPALILLLLQGPASLERMALDGRLPAALQALQRDVQTPGTERAIARREAVAIASLIAATGDPQFSKALFALLNASQEEVKELPAAVVVADEAGPPPDTPRQIGRERQGFLQAQRSRDGPLSR